MKKAALLLCTVLCAATALGQSQGGYGVPGGALVSPGFFPQSIFAGPYLSYFDEFITASNNSVNPIGAASGQTCVVNTANADINHIGQLLLTAGTGGTGTGITCGTQAQTADFVSPNSAAANWKWETAVLVQVLPGTTAGAFQAGLTTSPNSNPWTGGIEFYLSSANGVANDWYCRYSSTQTDSGIPAVANTWTRLSMYNDGVNAHWYVNGVEATACKVAIASLPSATQYPLSWSAVALSGTSVTMAVDYVSVQRNLVR